MWLQTVNNQTTKHHSAVGSLLNATEVSFLYPMDKVYRKGPLSGDQWNHYCGCRCHQVCVRHPGNTLNEEKK